ncbi:MAG: peptidylprolyl isomerase [Treponema sp.]|jgi:hypothetical protein|nr:peptidylprolyl isomerase [Treponema sp.]
MASREKKAPERENADSDMIRRFKQNPLVFIGTLVVLVIVIVAFVLVPAIVPEYGGGGNVDLTFGYYDKGPISYVPGNYFAQYYDMATRYLQSTMGAENYAYMSYEIWRESFEAAAVHTAMLQEMKAAGYEAPAKTVDRDVARLPQFQENGRFSAALYRQMDDNRRLALWRQTQDDIAKRHFLSDVTGLRTPAAEADFIGKMATTQRSFEMAVFSVDAYPEGEYAAYAGENPDLFRSVHLSIITIKSSEREAQRILASIKNGETTLEDAARAHSSGAYAERGGDMGIRMAHELSMDIPEAAARETVIALARGEYSDVMKTPDGWSFFRAEEAVQEADPSDPAVLEKVRYYMRNFQRGRMEDWAIGQANDFRALVDELGFREALLRRGMESRSFGPVPINYGSIDLFATLATQSVSEISNSDTNENFWKVAFSTPAESPSEPVVQGANVLVLYPTAETEAEEDSIVGIASTFSSYWLNSRTEQSLLQFFLNSPKMENRFPEVYSRYFLGE